MASIDILPLSLGGVRPPLNLLYELFSSKIDAQNLMYPLDLATNPTYGHAVQSAKDKSQFGQGDIRGVIAGGTFITTKDKADCSFCEYSAACGGEAANAQAAAKANDPLLVENRRLADRG